MKEKKQSDLNVFAGSKMTNERYMTDLCLKKYLQKVLQNRNC